MEFKHTSVLLYETVDGLNVKPDGIYVDGTLGGGGHASELCRRLSNKGTLIGIDRDKDALAAASARLKEFDCKKIFVQDNYSNIKEILQDLNLERIDGAMLDLGVSSFQLDNPERGFSYMQDAPLDMRMNRDDAFTAYDVVNEYSSGELKRIIKEYGEERWASRIADFIVKERAKKKIDSTEELVRIIKAAVPASARREGPHPAKRTFMAIRIEVNDELGQLRKATEDFIDVLAPGGRLSVITFHSLEDRIVKEAFAKEVNPCTCPPGLPVCVCGNKPRLKKITGKPTVAGEDELTENPRARSAKLRVVERV
ncbi:MAG: 16S rRNA (cytosine(1402)-N(4))-methyltransferase RsmH [Firmicutes bacterium]|nr:16S rRNA (cytosine(1402)-N(4))-methyltransferase RsmH [Clostridiales bacterium]MBQ4339893.1 16S rRNA (cytosine(1402)-N(4))-methyltransferase RsmH [Bacillota bacterium]